MSLLQGWVDQDFLGAMVHGRRSRLAEAARLDVLCRIGTLAELVRSVAPEAEITTVVELQRHLVRHLVEEVSKLAVRVGGASAALLEGLVARFEVENLKVLARGFATKADPKQIQTFIVPLPRARPLDVQALLSADSIEAFAKLIPVLPLRQGVLAAAEAYHRQPHSFFIESGLDCGYLKELMRLARALPTDGREEALPLILQEVDTFHLMLAARGRFLYGLRPDVLAPFHVQGARIGRATFMSMATAHGLGDMASAAVGHVIDALPVPGFERGEARPLDPAELEVLAWNRFLRLANRAFRWSDLGIGAVVAYTALRRVELANLITLSEGIRLGTAPDVLRQRLIPRAAGEVARV